MGELHCAWLAAAFEALAVLDARVPDALPQAAGFDSKIAQVLPGPCCAPEPVFAVLVADAAERSSAADWVLMVQEFGCLAAVLAHSPVPAAIVQHKLLAAEARGRDSSVVRSQLTV